MIGISIDVYAQAPATDWNKRVVIVTVVCKTILTTMKVPMQCRMGWKFILFLRSSPLLFTVCCCLLFLLLLLPPSSCSLEYCTRTTHAHAAISLPLGCPKNSSSEVAFGLLQRDYKPLEGCAALQRGSFWFLQRDQTPPE